jgi:PKD repeat protein
MLRRARERRCQKGKKLRALRAVVFVVILGLPAILAGSASAVIVHLPDGHTVSYLPVPGERHARAAQRTPHVFDEVFKNLDYNGGPVMTSNTDYTLYWRPKTATAYPSDYRSGVNTYFQALTHDSGGHQNTDSVASQYNEAGGQFANYDVKFGGELVDEDPYPSSKCTQAPICLTDAQIQTEIAKYVTEHELPTGLGVEYFLLTPEAVESCFEEGAAETCSANSKEPFYCAYHGDIHLGGGAVILYSNDPFVDNKLCDKPEDHINGSSDSALFGGLSHEHLESVTDPEPNNAWTDYLEGEKTGFEVGDKCNSANEAVEFGVPLGEVEVSAGKKVPFNQEIDGHKYLYQQEWSNQGHECLQRFTFSGTEPTAGYTAKVASSNTSIAFDAGGSTATGGVSNYSWNFNNAEEEFGGELFTHLPNPFESSFPNESEGFVPGEYRVALTVFAADGTSIGTARTLRVGGPGPTASIGVSASPTAGQLVTFDGSSSIDPPSGSIATYEWDFGDDSAVTGGATPTHTYATTGPFNVTLRVTGSDGLIAQTTRQVSVAAPGSGGVEGGGGGGGGARPTPVTTAPAAATPVPDSAFTAKSAASPKTGAISFTIVLVNPGTLGWSATFANGAFSSASRCKAGRLRLAGRCRPAKIAFAKGSETVGAAGSVTVTLKPSASALKALKNALKHKRGVPVSIVLTFQSALGGAPVEHAQTVTVKLKK